ncbi:uncharacterized protein [Nothobranchius furzeri]|uniref:uncharacterized protein isoform X2 n=1 Tax=Nothobranchius furzeri TaxID=105023 RepID=UPI002403ABDB|nr:uncharacterized protein LOC129157221 isoform X2 [Nothobranchius furzeri]
MKTGFKRFRVRESPREKKSEQERTVRWSVVEALPFVPARMENKKMPGKKRLRVPTQKMKDLQHSPLLNEQSESNTIIRSPLSEHGEEIPAMNASPDAGHATSRSSGGPPSYSSNTINTSPYGDHTPSPSPKGTDTSRPSPYGVHTASTSSYGLIHTSGPPPYGDRTLNPSPYGLNTSRPSPFGSYTPSPLLYGLNTSSPSSNRGHLLSTQLYGHANPGPSLYGGQTSSPSLYDLDTPGPSPAAGLPGSGVSLSDSGKASDQPQDRRDSGSSSDQGNIPPGRQEQNAWTPCDRCKGEVERILQQKRKIDEVLARIDPDQLGELQTLCDLIGVRHRDSPSSPLGQQELFPGSDVFISSFRLAAMNQASKPHSMRLFHALFDHLFTVEECQNAVPFGRPGNNPSGKEGKRVLDHKKVDAILTYVLRCATLPGWEQIEEAKLKKAFVNKCRARAGSKE